MYEIVLAAFSLSELLYSIILIIGLIAVIYVILRIAKSALKFIGGIIINSILGFLAIYLLNFFFNLGIPFILPIIIATALFGLPAVGTLAILRAFGIVLIAV